MATLRACAEDSRDIDHLVLNEAEITLPMFLNDLVAGTRAGCTPPNQKPDITNHSPAKVGTDQHESLRIHVRPVFARMPI